ncbi:16S rRNA (guanine(527)-N(7))-methyltransferase RsmG [Chelatococcus daeguensis]|uniref:16S rRNA (guanine(527)-N(7))-methyltransferase RsmG n=1 Tax=Chelatococcus daeguensis TaxID=444444 RepID=UPI0007AC19FE|nr:16S rRNA (guanine(527)-N(7))-methyltransferase RsmG [Chelatococcus daeguensis]KZE34680.1 16S rRNA (guanine(527)-N(7))-methyltransferase RsmG [Chelatococcus daeguensis]MBM3082515.1 16S rRNA (guanine(527)-N(7))-methyltransferase RsmG [Chelatococcus daeguensis]
MQSRIALRDDRAAALALGLIPDTALPAFDIYVDLLCRWQDIKNLVGPRTLDHVWTRHVADSAQLLPLAPTARKWIDIGTGAGFPGLVLAILLRGRPDCEIHLIESNSRKCAFLRAVSRETGAHAQIHAGRIEDILPRLGEADVITARALAPLTELLALGKDLLRTGAIGIFPKGQDLEAELTVAAKSWNIDYHIVPSVTDPQGRICIVRQLREHDSDHG